MLVEEYQANEYYRAAQKFCYPLYKYGELGELSFSSTATFLIYNGAFYVAFAAHALSSKKDDVDKIGFIMGDGTLDPISDICESIIVKRQDDVVLGRLFKSAKNRNHFNLKALAFRHDYDLSNFYWIGYPQKKAASFHKTKVAASHIMSNLAVDANGKPHWRHVKFLQIKAKALGVAGSEIHGEFDNTNRIYDYEGLKSKGHSLRGMSGGPIFFLPNYLSSEISVFASSIRFAGVGLSYDGKIIKGASSRRIREIIDEARI